MDARLILSDAFSKDGWSGVLSATKNGDLPGVPRIAVPEPQPHAARPMTLGFKVRFNTPDDELGPSTLTYLWPRLRPETKADRTLGAEMLLQVELVEEEAPARAASGRSNVCFNCGAADHWMMNCPQPNRGKRPRLEARDPHAEKQRELEAKAAETVRKDRKAQMLRSGCTVCGRVYHFLGSKDPGKRIDGKRTESIYFVAASGPEADAERLAMAGRRFYSVHEAWRALAAFPLCKSVPKMGARVELAFSGTAPTFDDRTFHVVELRGQGGLLSVLQGRLLAELPVGAHCGPNDIYVVAIDDIVGRLPSGQPSYDPTGDAYLLSDGNGLIALNLAEEITTLLKWHNVPLLTQIRGWWHGSVSKGVLSTSSLLPRNVIVVRASQIKVDASTGASISTKPSLEVNGCQRQPSEAKFTPFLVLLLSSLGGPPMTELLLEMQCEAAKPVRELTQMVDSGEQLSDEEAVELLRQLEPREKDPALPGARSAHDMLLAGMDTRDEHLRGEVLSEMSRKLRAIKMGKFAITDSCSLMVGIDHTCTLPEGDVVVLEEGRPRIAPRCALYKSPGLHPGDIRVQRAVPPTPEMVEHLRGLAKRGQNALIVSALGARSILDMIAGSDADGDCFSVIWNERLLGLLPESCLLPPWEKHPATQPPAPLRAPSELTMAELCEAMQAHTIRCQEGQRVLAKAANYWKAYADEHGARHDGSVQLAFLYMEALDSGKADALPKLPPQLQKPLPRHLQKQPKGGSGSPPAARAGGREGNKTPGGSALLQMYTAVDADLITGKRERPTCPEVWIDPDLSLDEKEPRKRELMDRWFMVCSSYRDEMKLLVQSYTPERWQQTIAQNRSELLAVGSPHDPSPELCSNVCALYEAFYSSRGQRKCGSCTECLLLKERDQRKSAKFIWAACGDLLLHVKGSNRRNRAQLALEPEDRTAPKAVDEARFALLQKKRNAGRRAIEKDEYMHDMRMRALAAADDDDDEEDHNFGMDA